MDLFLKHVQSNCTCFYLFEYLIFSIKTFLLTKYSIDVTMLRKYVYFLEEK